MDAIFMPSSVEKSFSPYKQLKNIPKRNSGINFVSNPSENSAPTSTIHGGGLLFAPPPSLISFSYPAAATLLSPIFYQNHHQLQQQRRRWLQQHQPPLLPLPTPNKPLHSSLPSRTRSLSSSPSNRKNNKTREQSLTAKRSKSKHLIITACKDKVEDQPKKDDLNLKPKKATKTQATSKSFVMASANSLGPDPNDLPVALASSHIAKGNVAKDLENFSGSVFTLSPPPSSLPLPKFSCRPKLSWNAEAAGTNAGATDDLRRLLRLR